MIIAQWLCLRCQKTYARMMLLCVHLPRPGMQRTNAGSPFPKVSLRIFSLTKDKPKHLVLITLSFNQLDNTLRCGGEALRVAEGDFAFLGC